MSVATSFRDPGGFCTAVKGHILRVVEPGHVAQVEGFLNSACARKFAASGKLIPARLLAKTEVAQWLQSPEFARALNGRSVGAVFEHERIEFPAFPCEWSPEMLHAAGELTLDLALDALRCGYLLKDAAPHNILFQGTKPVFVDLLSFEPRAPGENLWKPYAQFVRTFLLPLLAHKYWGTSLAEIFTTRRDGLEPQELFARCTWFQKLRPPFLTLITLPTLLARKGESVGRAGVPASQEEKSLFILESLFNRLRASLNRLRPRPRAASGWPRYMGDHGYGQKAFVAKEAFVRHALAEFKPAKVLDVGANTGYFSRIAAALGARVVAIDSDARCAGECFVRARNEGMDVMPLVVDIARPTAALGWRNRECASFLDRARPAVAGFDAVLMLALLHHLLITERVPLSEIIDLAAELTRSLLLIEFVPSEDPMFQRLLRGRDPLFAGHSRESFEKECLRQFKIVRAIELPGNQRWIYLLRRR